MKKKSENGANTRERGRKGGAGDGERLTLLKWVREANKTRKVGEGERDG